MVRTCEEDPESDDDILITLATGDATAKYEQKFAGDQSVEFRPPGIFSLLLFW